MQDFCEMVDNPLNADKSIEVAMKYISQAILKVSFYGYTLLFSKDGSLYIESIFKVLGKGASADAGPKGDAPA